MLTSREKEVMNLIMYGYNNPQISKKLCISYHTTKTHVLNIFQKLGVENRVEAAVKYITLLKNRRQLLQEIVESGFTK